MKLCIHCKFYDISFDDREPQCGHPTARKSPVDGSPDHLAYENRRYLKVHDEKSVEAMEKDSENRRKTREKYPNDVNYVIPGPIYVFYESCGMEAEYFEPKETT